MNERRQALGMTWAVVARDADITVETLRAIRRGKNDPSDLTKRGLDRALQWQPGSMQNVLNGGSPHPIGEHAAAREDAGEPDDADTAITPQLRALLEQAQQRTDERLTELTKKMDEQNELIKKLLQDKRGA